MASREPFSCAFTIGSDTRYLSVLRRWVGAVSDAAGRGRIGKSQRIALELALIEAVDNAIFHAHGGSKSKPIRVSMSVRDGEVVLEVVDTGGGIVDPPESLPEGMSSHGRGLFLIRSMMTSVVSRSRDGCHALRMKLTI